MSKFDAFREDRKLMGHDDDPPEMTDEKRLILMIALERQCEEQGWTRAAALARKEIDRLTSLP